MKKIKEYNRSRNKHLLKEYMKIASTAYAKNYYELRKYLNSSEAIRISKLTKNQYTKKNEN